METKKRLYILCLLLSCFVLPTLAQDEEVVDDDDDMLPDEELVAEGPGELVELHVTLFGIPLDASPREMQDVLLQHGLRVATELDTLRRTHLTGTLSGMRVTVVMDCNRERTKINFIRLSTIRHERTNQQEDFVRMSRWLHKEYGKPDWTGSVRSHPFNRWFIDFDHDIVLVATGSGTVECWLYENHDKRNVDYYSILKYCEKNPSPNVPYMTAQESVTWKNLGDNSQRVRKHVAKRKRGVGRRHKAYRGKKARAGKRGRAGRSARKARAGKRRRR